MHDGMGNSVQYSAKLKGEDLLINELGGPRYVMAEREREREHLND